MCHARFCRLPNLYAARTLIDRFNLDRPTTRAISPIGRAVSIVRQPTLSIETCRKNVSFAFIKRCRTVYRIIGASRDSRNNNKETRIITNEWGLGRFPDDPCFERAETGEFNTCRTIELRRSSVANTIPYYR